MGRIQLLDDALASQIAAGEVVERPASVAKELLENALDAGARRIEVLLEGGGIDRLCVADDGGGMAADDAALCFARHATSKLRAIDDLRRIGTFGFRGEALAAIASVARVRLLTREAGAAVASEVRVEGGKLVYQGEGAAPAGTRLEVRDLFFNVPARRKFLKSARTEVGHIEQSLRTAALGQPDIAFRLVSEGKTLLDIADAPRGAPLTHPRRVERAVACLGEQVREYLFPFEARDGELAIEGYVVAPLETRRDFAGMHLSVNGRPVQDRGLSQAARVAFRTLLEVGRQPIFALDLRMDPEWVDVNVHPRKAEVRFSDPRVVQGKLIRLLSDFLASTPWLTKGRARAYALTLPAAHDPEAQVPVGGPPAPRVSAVRVSAEGVSAERASAERASAEGVSAAGAPADTPRADPVSVAAAPADAAVAEDPAEAHRRRVREALLRFSSRAHSSPGASAGPSSRAVGSERLASAPPAPPPARDLSAAPSPPPPPPRSEAGLLHTRRFADLRVVGQVGATFLLLEGADGLVVIDQHAAHERVVFERLRASVHVREAQVQPLLFPVTMALRPLESAALEEYGAELLAFGIELEPFGEGTALLRSVPGGLDAGRAEVIARDALAGFVEVGRADALDDVRDQICARLACHGSVRKGQSLAGEEIRALLRALDDIDLGAHCPHGRPVVRTLRYGEMARWFDRE